MANATCFATWMVCVIAASAVATSAEPDSWPLPWEIVSIEETHARLAEKRAVRVIYPQPEDEDELRRCVRQVYDSMRRDVLEADGLDESAGHVVNVQVFWDRSEEQISRFHGYTPMLQASLSVSKPLPESIKDDQIKVHWRDPGSQPSRRVRQLHSLYEKLHHAYVLDFKEQGFPKNGGLPSAALLAERDRFERGLSKRVYREVAGDSQVPEEDVRQAVHHVLNWQNGLKVTPKLLTDSIAREREDENKRK